MALSGIGVEALADAFKLRLEVAEGRGQGAGHAVPFAPMLVRASLERGHRGEQSPPPELEPVMLKAVTERPRRVLAR